MAVGALSSAPPGQALPGHAHPSRPEQVPIDAVRGRRAAATVPVGRSSS